MPYSYNPDFVGRSEILEVLKSQLGHTGIESQSKGNRKAALHGLGGVGYVNDCSLEMNHTDLGQKNSGCVGLFALVAGDVQKYINLLGSC